MGAEHVICDVIISTLCHFEDCLHFDGAILSKMILVHGSYFLHLC